MQQYVMEELCNYDTFISLIMGLVKDIMGEEFSVKNYRVMKNNSLELDSLVILKKGANFAPNIYLSSFYEEYRKGADPKDLAERLCSIYLSCDSPSVGASFSYSYNDVKSFIIYRLVSFERNKKLLGSIPHIRYLDLAITFHCLIREDDDGIGTIRITNEHLKMWEVSLEELFRMSVENTRSLFPYSIRSMDDVIMGMLGDEYKNSAEDGLAEMAFDEIVMNHRNSHNKMYILTNQKGINGATCLLYSNVLKEFSLKIKSDFFVIPSSIHEVILVPYDKSITKEILTEMVRDVNRTQVARDEILSDVVYYYSIRKNELSM